jgi:transposase
VLQDSGIKLSSVATNVLGWSGRAMLNALMGGTTDAEQLAELARGRLRSKLPALRQALVGRFRPHHAFLVGRLLAHIDYLEESILEISGGIAGSLGPFGIVLERLVSIPGVGRRTAEVLIAETGADIFPAPRIFQAQQECVPATTRVRANAAAARHGAATPGSATPWSKPAMLPLTPEAPRLLRAIGR